MAVIQSDAAGGAASSRPAARLVMEAIGNFVLVFAFGLAITTHSWFAPLLIGVPVVAMLCSSTRLPRAYCNPALTLAMLIRRRIVVRDALACWLVQSGAGLLAAVSVCASVDPGQLSVISGTVKYSILLAALALDLVITCALCVVAVDVSTDERPAIGGHLGWPIAVDVVAGVIAIGAITTGAFDPRVSVCDDLLGFLSWPTLWVYVVSQLLSGIAATITYVSLADHH
jgi:aquaporin Z